MWDILSKCAPYHKSRNLHYCLSNLLLLSIPRTANNIQNDGQYQTLYCRVKQPCIQTMPAHDNVYLTFGHCSTDLWHFKTKTCFGLQV